MKQSLKLAPNRFKAKVLLHLLQRIEILLKDLEFDSLLERGEYSLIVGIDEITNLASLEALERIKTLRPNLKVKAFDHNNKGSLFHPKLSYFKNTDESGTLIIGSGNLTLGGLRRNREAFSLLALSNDEFQRIEQYWNAWTTQSTDLLKDIDHDDVIRKAKENQYVKMRIPQPEDEITLFLKL